MIGKREFASIMAVASAAVGKDLTRDQARVYWGLLNDLPREALKTGISRALLEHEFPTIPTVGMIRRLSVESMVAPYLTPSEAWSRVRTVLVTGSGFEEFKKARAELPDLVAKVASDVGWQFLRDSRSSDGRKAFVYAYRDAVEKDRRDRILPESLHQTMARLPGDTDDNPSDTERGAESQQPLALEEKSDTL